MVHFITINWLNYNGVWIWNRVRGIYKWILLRINLNIYIINGIKIHYIYDIQNHRNSFGGRCPLFEVKCCSLAVTNSWWIKCFVTTKGVELVHISSKNFWKEVRSTDYAGVILDSNYTKSFINSLLSNANIWNNWLDIFYISLCVIWSIKMVIALTLIIQVSWASNNL